MLAFGTPGGDQQDQWSLEFFLAHAVFGLDLQAAIDAPMFHSTHFPSSFYPRDGRAGPGRDRGPRAGGDDRRAARARARRRGRRRLVARPPERDLARARRGAARRRQPAWDAGLRGRSLSAYAPASGITGQPPASARVWVSTAFSACPAHGREFPRKSQARSGRVRPMARRFEKLDDSRLAARVHRGRRGGLRGPLRPPPPGAAVLLPAHARATPRTARTRCSRPSCARTRPWSPASCRMRSGRGCSRSPATAARRCWPRGARRACRSTTSSPPSTGWPRTSRARRPARAGGRPRPPARGAARGARAVRARRHVAGRDRGRDRRPRRQGQGARLPGAHRADGRARRPLDAVRDDPRGARGRARRRAAARAAAPAPAQLRALRGLPHRRRRAARGPGLDPARRPGPGPEGGRARRGRRRRRRGRGRRRRCRRWPTSWR